MDKEQERSRARFMVLESLFEHEGWDVLMDELRNELDVIKDQLLEVKDWDAVNIQKGRVRQILDMLYLPDTVANMALVEVEEPLDADV
jgi:hypothetical protein